MTNFFKEPVSDFPNYARFFSPFRSDPTSVGGLVDGLPRLPEWSRERPSYLAFRSGGPAVMYDYPQTYNWIMLDKWDKDAATTTSEQSSSSSTTTTANVTSAPGDDDGGSAAHVASPLIAMIANIFACYHLK